MKAYVTKYVLLGVALFVATAAAQDQAGLLHLQAQLHELASVAPFPGATYLGVALAEIDANRAKELKLKETYGSEITRVEEGSPAEKAGVKAGDVVLEYNGQRVEGMEQFGRMVRETPAGREVKLTISRDGALETLTATLASRKGRALSESFHIDMPEIRIPDIPQIYTAT